MRWPVKCAIDNVKALVPFARQLRALKHAAVPFEEPAGVDDNTISDGLRQLDWIRGGGLDLAGAVAVEIGPGWQPIIPLILHLAGADKVILADPYRLLTRHTFSRAMRVLRSRRSDLARAIGSTEDDVEARLSGEEPSLESYLARFRFAYLAPCDTTRLPLPSQSVDLVVSRAVLEHVSPSLVEGLFRESMRVLRPTGMTCHLIDNSDHWSHRDKRITAVNFLKFSDAAFRLTTVNPQNYQNRLRHSDYSRMLRQAGFAIDREDRVIDPAGQAAVGHMKLDRRFRDRPAEDLACIMSMFLAKPHA